MDKYTIELLYSAIDSDSELKLTLKVKKIPLEISLGLN